MPRPKVFDQDKVLEAAMLRFWKQGYSATSVRDLEKSTGLTPGSLYHEFGSKLGLFERALDFYVDSIMRTRVERYLDPTCDPLTGIRQFLVSAIKDVPKRVQGDACLLVNTASELGDQEPGVNRVLQRGFKLIRSGLLQQLERARAAGQIRIDLDIQAAAQQLVILLSGLLVAAKCNTPVKQLEETVDLTLESYQ